MIKRLMVCVMCMMLVSACDTGGGSSPDATVNRTSGENYVPIDLDVITETTTGMVISGAVEHNTGEVPAFWIRLDRGLESFRNIEVETRDGYLLRLTHRADIEEGTYPINTTLDTVPEGNNVVGGLLYLWSPDESQQFTLNPEGTMSIRYRGEDVLGSFMLSVENPAGESVTVEGQFFTQESESAVR